MIKFIKVDREKFEKYENSLGRKLKCHRKGDYVLAVSGSWYENWWKWLIILPLYIPMIFIFTILYLIIGVLSFLANLMDNFNDFVESARSVFLIGKIVDVTSNDFGPKTKFKKP